MPNRRPISPNPLDVVPLKDVARSLRFIAERGGKTLRESLPLDSLPEPAARVAEGALSSVHRLGDAAGRHVSALAHALLDDDSAAPVHLITPDPAEAEARFAATVYTGLRLAMVRLGAENCLVSESAARAAWRVTQEDGPADTDVRVAADLFEALLAQRAIRDAILPPACPFALAEATRIATFAVLLSLLGPGEAGEASIPAAVDLTLALRDDLAKANSAAAVAALLQEFRDHV